MRNLQQHLKQAFAALKFSDANSLHALTARLAALDQPPAFRGTQPFARRDRAATLHPGGPLSTEWSPESAHVPKDGQPYR